MFLTKKLEKTSVSEEEILKFKAQEPGSLILSEERIREEILKRRKIPKDSTGIDIKGIQAEDWKKERKDWERFYEDNFNEKPDLSRVKVPSKPKGNNWRLMFIIQGLTMNQAFDKCKELFNSWRYTEDLDKLVTKNARETKNHYAIWVKDKEEPDIEYLGKSTQDADPDMKIGITLMERLIFEIIYYTETKKHLDIKGITFCTGSRYASGDVPGVSWFGGHSELEVNWYGLALCDPRYGLRAAVS